MLQTKLKVPYILSVVIVILAIIASLGGLFIGNLYRDNAYIKSAWHGNDFITLTVAVPIMIAALLFSIRNSKRAQLVWIGTLGYMLYNYTFYLYGASFNRFFLIYAAELALSIYALIFSLTKIDVDGISKVFNTRTPVKYISSFMLFFAFLLGGMWIAISLGFVATGKVPDAIVQTGNPTGVVFATDLTLLIPILILSGVLLWERRPWGYILSTIVMTKTATYGLAMISMTEFAYIESGVSDPMMPLWIFLSIGCLISFAALLWNMNFYEKNKLE